MTEPAKAVPTFEFYGETFAYNLDVSEWELGEFLAATSEGDEMNSLRGMAIITRFTKELVAEQDMTEGEGDDRKVVAWGRNHFVASARRNRATGEALLEIVYQFFGVKTDRPTEAPSDSSDGRSTTPLKSVSSSAEKAAQAFPGRPDLQVVAALSA